MREPFVAQGGNRTHDSILFRDKFYQLNYLAVRDKTVTGHSGRPKHFLSMQTLLLSVAGYVAVTYVVGVFFWLRKGDEASPGYETLYFVLSPVSVPLAAYMVVRDRLRM